MADVSPPSKSSSSEAEWTCEDCGNVNFGRRSTCNKCQMGAAPNGSKKRKLGTEIGKAAAEKSRGLFSADDWQCNKCGNVNWARRQQCNVCNAPKFGEVEERTGFGGGYNDRGVVEYKERQDSDDEFDEFGRRKKRRSNYATSNSSREDDKEDRELPRVVVRQGEEEEEEEEDEEDDDDGDLSKYDLSDWGDVTEETGKDKEKKKEKRE